MGRSKGSTEHVENVALDVGEGAGHRLGQPRHKHSHGNKLLHTPQHMSATLSLPTKPLGGRTHGGGAKATDPPASPVRVLHVRQQHLRDLVPAHIRALARSAREPQRSGGGGSTKRGHRGRRCCTRAQTGRRRAASARSHRLQRSIIDIGQQQQQTSQPKPVRPYPPRSSTGLCCQSHTQTCPRAATPIATPMPAA